MTSFQLKIIALITMIIDHIGAAFPDSFPFIFRCIGRISFPLYAFLISEGCKHTKNIKKYLFRIGIFALISEIPYDLLFQYPFMDINFFEATNIFYTLFVGTLSIYMYKIIKDYLKNDLIALVISSTMCFLGYILSTDYGALGILLILLLYYFDKKFYQIILIFSFILCKYLYPVYYDNILLVLFSMLSLFFIYMYNNKKGKSLKWFFYIIYPLHLTLLHIIVKFFR